jgi:hypothetical protein
LMLAGLAGGTDGAAAALVAGLRPA